MIMWLSLEVGRAVGRGLGWIYKTTHWCNLLYQLWSFFSSVLSSVRFDLMAKNSAQRCNVAPVAQNCYTDATHCSSDHPTNAINKKIHNEHWFAIAYLKPPGNLEPSTAGSQWTLGLNKVGYMIYISLYTLFALVEECRLTHGHFLMYFHMMECNVLPITIYISVHISVYLLFWFVTVL